MEKLGCKNLAASEAQWEYPILTLHIAVFQNATLSSILSSFISYIQAASTLNFLILSLVSKQFLKF